MPTGALVLFDALVAMVDPRMGVCSSLSLIISTKEFLHFCLLDFMFSPNTKVVDGWAGVWRPRISKTFSSGTTWVAAFGCCLGHVEIIDDGEGVKFCVFFLKGTDHHICLKSMLDSDFCRFLDKVIVEHGWLNIPPKWERSKGGEDNEGNIFSHLLPFCVLHHFGLEGDLGAKDLGHLLLVLDGEAWANFFAINVDNGGSAPFFKHVANDA
jgi:hypothetical protein